MPDPTPPRIAIVTGGSAGLGRATAEALAARGFHLVLSSRQPEAAAREIAACHHVPVRAVAGSIADPAVVPALIAAAEAEGGLDALFLNHGGAPVRPVLALTEAEWQAAFEMMVAGPLRILRAAVPLFRARGGGRVAAVSSFTVRTPTPGNALSNSLRAALVNALRTAAQELGPDNILINAIGPGYFATESLAAWNAASAAARGRSPAEVAEEATAAIPLRRYGQPADFGRLAAFLLSEDNAYVSGQHILIDGALA